MQQLPDRTVSQLYRILLLTTLLNLVTPLFMAWPILPGFEGAFRLAGALGLLVFVCLHGWYRYGWTPMLIFFSLSFAITWSTESLSIATGFPFGQYAYTDLLGDKLGQVPLMIMPAYFFVGYLAWTMGCMLLGEAGFFAPLDAHQTTFGWRMRIFVWLKIRHTIWLKKRNIVLVPLVASVLMVFWNACFDPIMSTVEGNWIWKNGGPYFGVPISNFFGWFVTVYLVFQCFALYLAIFFRMTSPAAHLATSLVANPASGSVANPTYGLIANPASGSVANPVGAEKGLYWIQVPLMYIGQGLPYFLYAFFRKDHDEWQIYQSMSIMTVATMFLAAMICLVLFGVRCKNHQINADAQNTGKSQVKPDETQVKQGESQVVE